MDRTLSDTLNRLYPTCAWVLRGNDYAGLEWLDTVTPKPTPANLGL